MSDTPADNESQDVPPPEVPSYVAPMKTSDVVNAIPGPIVKGYSAAALLGLLLFFLPWVNVSCQDVTLVTQTGLQLVQGDFSENENAKKELDEKFKGMDFGSGFQMSTRSFDEQKFPVVNIVRFDEGGGFDEDAELGKDDFNRGAAPKDNGGGSNSDRGFQDELVVRQPPGDDPFGGGMIQPGDMTLELSQDKDNKAEIKKMREQTGPFLLAVGAPVGFLLAGVLGLVMLVTKSPSKPVLPLVGGAIASLSLLVTMVIKLPIETAMFADVPPGMDMSKFISVSHTIWFFLALLLALLVLAGTIVHFMSAAKSAQQKVPSG